MTNNGNDKITSPNFNTLKGTLAIIFGVMFIVLAYKIVLNIIFFAAGLMLVYYGLMILNVKQATDYIDKAVGKIKKLLFS